MRLVSVRIRVKVRVRVRVRIRVRVRVRASARVALGLGLANEQQVCTREQRCGDVAQDCIPRHRFGADEHVDADCKGGSRQPQSFDLRVEAEVGPLQAHLSRAPVL